MKCNSLNTKYLNKETIKKKIIKERKVYEYLFKPETKMVGHVYKNGNKQFLCVKGAYESVLPLCSLDDKERHVIMEKIHEYASYGYRVMAIAKNNNIQMENLHHKQRHRFLLKLLCQVLKAFRLN